MYQSWLFFGEIGHAKSVGFRFYSAIWRSESRISSRCLEITSISLIYSLTFSRKKELLFWLSRSLNRLRPVWPVWSEETLSYVAAQRREISFDRVFKNISRVSPPFELFYDEFKVTKCCTKTFCLCWVLRSKIAFMRCVTFSNVLYVFGLFMNN